MGQLLSVADPETADAISMSDPHTALPQHQPVMDREVLQYLNPHPGAMIIDGTVGLGGHSLRILPQLLPDGRLIAIDRDRDALQLARQQLTEFQPHVTFVHENFRNLPDVLKRIGLSLVDGVLLDLGMSSFQVDRDERGFSFSKEGPLDMRMDRDQDLTAEVFIRDASIEELEQIFRTFGEERFATSIARRIADERRHHPITATTQLARMITDAVPPRARYGRLHPATRTFQALRMAVNDELGALGTVLGSLEAVLNPGGRVVILTFHSLEDRLVKHTFAQGARENRWTVLTKKPVRPTATEVSQNPRARSAKLRCLERR